MASVLTKAAKGNRAAITRLYQQTKKDAYFLAQQLLRDDEKAEEATVKAYREVLQLSALEALRSEDEAANAVQAAVANHCKAILTRANPKALRLPTDRRFDIREIPAERPSDDAEAVFAVFNELQRVIFVLHAASALTEEQILKITKLDQRTMQAALEAQQQNLEKLLPNTSAEAFTADFAGRAANVMVPNAVDDAVEAVIGETVAPVEKAAKKHHLKVVLILLAVCAVLAGFSALLIWDITHPDTNKNNTNTNNSAVTTTTNAAQASVGTVTSVKATHYADIDIKDYGVITVALDSTTAPETVFNFKMLADNKFYDGLTFHRIMEGFMMQGGDPKGNGTGGSDKNITGEFASNGVENPLSHVRGAISMARSSNPNSASSQFFIVHKDSTFLDGEYAVFGYVTEGMDIVDAICTAAKPIDDNGTIPAQQQPVINSVKVRKAE